MTKRWWAAAGLVLVMAVGSPLLAANNDPLAGLSLTPIELPELHEGAFVARDVDGIPHIVARNAHDVYFIAGFIQARDRLFQMDLARRQASGTLAEVLGPAVLGRDVELRTLGLRRAAERSLPVILDESRAALDAFAAGVNAYVAHHGLPLEYTLLGLTQFEPWTALDSMTVAKGAAFSLSFDLDIAPTQALMAYQQTGAAAGFDGVALFFADVYRSAPFEKWATVPEAGGSGTHQGLGTGGDAESRGPEVAPGVTPAALALGARYLERVRDIPLLQKALDPSRQGEAGSNLWVADRKLSLNNRPILANDPHLGLDAPSTFYQMHFTVTRGNFDVVGNVFPGTPLVVHGQNLFCSWGSTVNPLDVTDTFQEQVVPDASSPSGFSTLYLGALEHVLPIPEVFRYNTPGDGTFDNVETAPPGAVSFDVYVPAATLIVPRRNLGPIIALDQATGAALSVQYTGFSATREADAIFLMNRAQNLPQFVRALQFFDVGSQNWVYADVHGHTAYFTSAEVPIREDLQALSIEGLPPAFIRNGQGGNEWIPDPDPGPGQAIPYEILSWEEMPKAIDPPRGWAVNANQDPVGTTFDNDPYNQLRPGGGIYYLNHWYDFGLRAWRIATLMKAAIAKGYVTVEDYKRIQADVVLRDAAVLTPYILAAFDHAADPGAHPDLVALAADPAVADAVERLRAWDFTAPTGVMEGYDATDVDGVRAPPGDDEIAASVAATIFSVWRGQVLRGAIDDALAPYALAGSPGQIAVASLRHLLETFDATGGVGASGITFFPTAGVDDPAARRDIVLLRSLRDALELIMGEAFAPAFGGSTDPLAWRWGRLHRIVLDHPLGGPFSMPPAGGAILPSFPDLPGLAADGGFGVVDASNHDPRADAWDEFMFGSGPARRYVGEMGKRPGTIKAFTVLPGGESGVLGSRWYANLLPLWLTNDYYPVRQLVWTGPICSQLAEAELYVRDADDFRNPFKLVDPPGHSRDKGVKPPKSTHGNGNGNGSRNDKHKARKH